MFIRALVLISSLLLVVAHSFSVYKIVSSKLNVTFKYTDGVDGESDLHECKVHEACNVVHNRFWASSLTERLCRCPNGKECPWQYMQQVDNSSIVLNNKSQLKFCNPVIEMDTCVYMKEAAMVYGKSDRNNSYLIPYNVTIDCACPETHYWRLQKYTYKDDLVIQVYKCVKKRMCDTQEFCGLIRSDFYSTYYKCTCPQNHLCIFKDRVEENVQELLYSGPAYKAYCLPFKGL